MAESLASQMCRQAFEAGYATMVALNKVVFSTCRPPQKPCITVPLLDTTTAVMIVSQKAAIVAHIGPLPLLGHVYHPEPEAMSHERRIMDDMIKCLKPRYFENQGTYAVVAYATRNGQPEHPYQLQHVRDSLQPIMHVRMQSYEVGQNDSALVDARSGKPIVWVGTGIVNRAIASK